MGRAKHYLAMLFALVGCLLVIGSPIYSVYTVNHSRHQNLVDFCRETNHRHDATIKQINQLYAKALKDAPRGRRAQLRRSLVATDLIIEALAPKTPDCNKAVERKFIQ